MWNDLSLRVRKKKQSSYLDRVQESIHKYRVHKELGEGCEGTVYKVSKESGRARFILKVFNEQGCHAINQVHTAGFQKRDVGPSGEHLAR